MLRPNELVISDDNFHLFLDDQVVDGERKSRGLIPRNYDTHPSYGSEVPFGDLDLPLIPRSEWADRIAEMEANKSRVSDIRRSSGPGGGHIPSLDQDGVG